MEVYGCFVQVYTPNVAQQRTMLEHIANGAATQVSYIKTSCFTMEVTSEQTWRFGLGVQNGIDVEFCEKISIKATASLK